MAAGNMSGSDSASPRSVWRSRRPHSKPRNFMHENRETSEIPVANLSDRTAGEGLGHTARMYFCEESDSGIVPMNHSNKDGASLAESEEGRPARADPCGGQSAMVVPTATSLTLACPTGAGLC